VTQTKPVDDDGPSNASYYKPDGAWARMLGDEAQRLRSIARTMSVLLPLIMVLSTVGVVLTLAPVGLDLLGIRHAWLPVLVFLIIAFPIVGMWRQVARLEQTRRIVGAHDGRVCPICRAAMTAVTEAAEARQDERDKRWHCPNGHPEWPGRDLDHYWKQYGAAQKGMRRQSPFSWVISGPSLKWPGNRPQWEYTQLDAEQRPMMLGLAWSVVVLWLIWAGLEGPSLALLIALIIIAVPIVIGGLLIRRAAGRRQGSEQYCMACGHARGPSEPEQCPECGSDLRSLTTTFHGQFVAGPRWAFVAGFCCIVIGLGSFMTGLHRLAYDLVPLNVVHSTQALNPGSDAMWASLGRRTLSAEETASFATLALDMRARQPNRFRLSRAESWLDGVMTTGTAPPSIADRYYGETIGLQFTSIGRDGATGPWRVQLRMLDCASMRLGSQRVVLLESVQGEYLAEAMVDDVTVVPDTRILRPGRIDRGGIVRGPEVTTIVVSEDAPDPVELEVTYWVVVVGPRAQSSAVTWDAASRSRRLSAPAGAGPGTGIVHTQRFVEKVTVELNDR
jgi:hypothetical protein